MGSLSIRNATVVTQDDSRRVLVADVRVEDSRIVAIGGPGAKGEADRTIDGAGQVLMPGLINLHTHLPMTLFRGYGDDMHLEAWLHERIWPAEERFTPETMRAGALLGCLESIAAGTTTLLDMYMWAEDAIAPAVRQAGLRAYLSEGMVDTKTPPGEPNRKLPAIERFAKSTANDPLVRGGPGPHATYTCNDETYRESARIAHENKVPMHTHCGETRTEVYTIHGRTGRRPVAQIAHAGALGPRTVLAHCGWTTKSECADIATAGASVAHCPVSNMKLATGGTCPVPELQETGVKVGLGTDGAASNNTLDLLQTAKFAALVQKQHRWDATALPACRVLDMLTRDAADALHRPDLGRIVPGATADMVLIDFRRPHLTPRHDVTSDLVYSASGRDVSATIVHGRVLMAEGKFETLDAARVMQDGQSAAGALVKGVAP
jgi:5-methylthioadenosine/S-adenosylhomocysteine deaminase